MNIPPKKIPGLNPLVLDYLTCYEKIAPFYSGYFQRPQSFHSVAKQRYRIALKSRDELVAVLQDQNTRFGCGERTMHNIEKLAAPRSLAVVTGQQAGLFSGPLYTVYKALTTVKLAQKLSQKLKTHVVPVFYLVSEDHDFKEVRWVKIIDQSNNVIRFEYDSRTPERTPVCRIMLDETINHMIERVAETLSITEFSEMVFAALKNCYRPGLSFSDAFACWMCRLVKQYGVVLLDASDPRIKLLVGDVFETELIHNSPSNQIAASTGKMLQELGYHEQIRINPQRPNLFILDQGRHSIERRGEEFVNLGNGSFFDASKAVREHPEHFSPKALLRPIVQDSLLPTVAYVGGPSEIAYFAQLKGVYKIFGLHMPVVFPRAGFTIVEVKIQRHLQRLNLEAFDFAQGFKKVLHQVMREKLPPELEKRVTKARGNIKEEWRRLAEVTQQIEPTLQATLDKASTRVSHQLNGIEQKLLNALRKREKVVEDQLFATYNNLFPDGGLQERQLNILPYLVKYGWGLIDRIFDEIDLDSVDHKILEL